MGLITSFLFTYFLLLIAFVKQSLFRLKEKIKPRKRNLSAVVIIQPPEEEEEKQTGVNLNDQKMESFLSFQFRTYEEFAGKNGENLNQVSDDENSDYDFFEVESGVDDVEWPQVSSETDGFSADNSEFVSPNLGKNVEEEKLENNSHLFSSDEDESLISDSDSDSSLKFSFRGSVIDSISDDGFEVDPSIDLEKDIGYGSDENEGTQLEDGIQKQTTPNVNPTEAKVHGEQNSEMPGSGEEKNRVERQWEHEDLVEQLKMEIKKVKAIGLPTILEEPETPKVTEDLKPWKFQYEDTLDELHKLYKSYKERMRKFDTLNYQKMHHIGFLRPRNTPTSNKVSNPSMTGVASLDCLSCKGKSVTDQFEQPMKSMRRDLEIVYVGQLCLSWEFLRLEYGKSLKLWDTDFLGIRRYNNVAHKFQQFQLLITKFLKDEPSQGPRIVHYAKTRCLLRNLLQVPLIREDDLRDKDKDRKGVITSVKLVEIIEESIRTLWQLIRTDKYTSNTVLVKACGRSNVELQNPADELLLEELRSTLQKKEKRLKELTMSENCILRKIRKQQKIEDRTTDDVRHFFSQADLKLVCRVLNMSKISTQQFGWCSDKLNRINVVAGKLYVDSSFLLFP